MKRLLFTMLAASLAIALPAQGVKVIGFDELEPRLNFDNDTVYVVNFMATWCGPCKEEIPYFVRLDNELRDKNFKMLFVSLDMPTPTNSSLMRFIENNNIKAEVVLLDDPDFNSWIDRVDDSWKGSIPATLVYYRGYRKFTEGSLNYSSLARMTRGGLK